MCVWNKERIIIASIIILHIVLGESAILKTIPMVAIYPEKGLIDRGFKVVWGLGRRRCLAIDICPPQQSIHIILLCVDGLLGRIFARG